MGKGWNGESKRHSDVQLKGKKEIYSQKSFTTMIGDGKMPNKYWVSWSNDFLICKDGSCESASDTVLKNIKGETHKHAFDTYEGAKKLANEYISQIGETPDENGVNTVTIEDRLSGEIFCGQIGAYLKNGLLTSYHFTYGERTDYEFSKEQMEKKGYVFK